VKKVQFCSIKKLIISEEMRHCLHCVHSMLQLLN